MELIGKNIKIHLSTPLLSVDSCGFVTSIQGKVLEVQGGGFLMKVESILPKKDGSKFPYSTIFIPTHKIDFLGVLS